MPTTLPPRREPPRPEPAPLSLGAVMVLICIATLVIIIVFDQLNVSFAGDGASSLPVTSNAGTQIAFPP